MKAVFDTRPTSDYDDDLYRHYQFPRRYLSLIQQCLNDWVVLRRARADGGDLAYFAIAKLATIEEDTSTPKLNYVRFSDFIAFDTSVPWKPLGNYAEEALRELPTSEVGIYLRGKSVRYLNDADFNSIVTKGIQKTIECSLTQDPNIFERERRIEAILTKRLVRDANFRMLVNEAYGNRCAVTHLKIADHKGNTEAHAAHIWGVEAGGPDIVQNGIALSATIHWLFDHYLISITDDYKLIVAENLVPREYLAVFQKFGGKLNLPVNHKLWPLPGYLAKHRERFCKNNPDHHGRAYIDSI